VILILVATTPVLFFDFPQKYNICLKIESHVLRTQRYEVVTYGKIPYPSTKSRRDGTFDMPDIAEYSSVGGVSKVLRLPPVETGGYSWATPTALNICDLHL
jgi:hypothetical protein